MQPEEYEYYAENLSIPGEYGEYFEIDFYPDFDDFEFKPGEKVGIYTILGYVKPIDKYEDLFDEAYYLIDDPEYPVVNFYGRDTRAVPPNLPEESDNLEEAMTNREKLMKRFPELNLTEDAEMSNNKLNKQEILDWISDHELAWEDFVNYFEDIYQSSAEVPMDEIIGWISEHDELAEDFEARFNAGIFTDADDYDDFSEEEIEEHLAIDAYDQLNSPNILEINTTKPNKLKENVEGKWTIGSNKLVSTDSQEYANLVDLAKLLQERSPNGYEYRVEKTYEDFGAGMQWYTIICDEKNGWGTHQVLSPREWIYLANTGDVEGTYEDVVSGEYFQDKVKKDRTVSLFKYMDTLD